VTNFVQYFIPTQMGKSVSEPEDLTPENTPPTLPPTLPTATATAINAASEATADDGIQALRTALAEDMQSIGDALFAAYKLEDIGAARGALKKISMQTRVMPAIS
jgi:hypothetical protein